MFTLIKTTLLLAGGALLASCASGAADTSGPQGFAEDVRLGDRVDRICFGRSIDGFSQATRQTVVVEAGVNDYYLIETFGACNDLDWAQSIQFDQATSCVTTGDSLIAYTSAFGPRESDMAPRRCPIRAIYEWDPDAEDAAGDNAASGAGADAAR